MKGFFGIDRLPIVYPIEILLKIEPIWFLTIVAIAVNLSGSTPPIGLNLFVLKGMQPQREMKTIFRGSIPFFIGTLLLLIVLFIFSFVNNLFTGYFEVT